MVRADLPGIRVGLVAHGYGSCSVVGDRFVAASVFAFDNSRGRFSGRTSSLRCRQDQTTMHYYLKFAALTRLSFVRIHGASCHTILSSFTSILTSPSSCSSIYHTRPRRPHSTGIKNTYLDSTSIHATTRPRIPWLRRRHPKLAPINHCTNSAFEQEA